LINLGYVALIYGAQVSKQTAGSPALAVVMWLIATAALSMDFDVAVRSEISVMAVITSCNGISRVPSRLLEAHARVPDTPNWKNRTRTRMVDTRAHQ
jgi:hypothetical protein